jgi:hypothetical protein
MSESSMEILKLMACCVVFLILAIPTMAFVFVVSGRLFEFVYDKLDDWLTRFQ